LYEKYRKSVCTVAASFHSLDADDIQDVVQDTFVRAFHALAALKDTEHLAAWLSVIARNRASSFLASRGRRAKLSDDSHRDSLLCAQPPGSALEQLEQETDRRIVRREIEALQEGPEKETVLLFYIEGALTTREIAQRLGVGKSAVSMRLERFRKRVGAQVASRCAGRDRGHDK
jgi:RNA polymerase sigma-70 factor (ECF subfamily)